MRTAGKLYLLFIAILLSTIYVSPAQVTARNTYFTVSAFRELQANNYLAIADIGKIYRVNKFIGLGGEISVYKFSDQSYSSVGLGMRPVVDIYLLQRKHYQIFTEGRGGIVYMFPEYKRCAINFTFVWNSGVDIEATKQTKIRLGLCYHHYSNGKTYSEATNAPWDGVGASIGLQYNFRNYQ